MNQLPCGKCKRYDPILGSNEKRTRRGWCVKRSKYPTNEGPGQLFPAEAERVAPGQLAQPFIVREDQVLDTCDYAEAADYDPYEAKKGRVTVTDEKGQRILS